MQILNWNVLDEAAQERALMRPVSTNSALSKDVRAIIDTVRTGGDQAVLNCTRRFDGIAPAQLRVEAKTIERAWEALDQSTHVAMSRAADNIIRFHRTQKPQEIKVEVEPGLICQRLVRPFDCVGLYVPGGSAPLFSSLMMAALPAKLAGVRRIVVASSPDEYGQVAPVVLAAAKLCAIDEIYCMGGAQAIAAMGLGTDSVPRVDKIFGPGNQWVAEAKAQMAQMPGGPAIDLPAGPSEVMVLADDAANASYVAADLLSQAEHDPQAQVIMLTLSNKMAKCVEAEVQSQLETLPRSDIARRALQNARLIIVQGRAQMLEIANIYAPEHLILQCADPEALIAGVQNAGSVFVGPYTPESLGDYASGTNHVLPTAGAARAYSGLGLESFSKFITVQQASKRALQSLGPCVQALARREGLEAHARAISVRLDAR